MIRDPFRFYNAPPAAPTYFGGTLPTVNVESPYPSDYVANAVRRGGSRFIQPMLGLMGQPQRDIVELLTGVEQTPSEAMGIENPYGSFAIDAVLDPVNIIGAGTIASLAEIGTKGLSARSMGELARRYARNPFTRINPQPILRSRTLIPSQTLIERPSLLAPPQSQDQLDAFRQLQIRLEAMRSKTPVVNKSGLNKGTALARIKDEDSKKLLEEMSDKDFQETAMTADRKIVEYVDDNVANDYLKYGSSLFKRTPKMETMPIEGYIDEFNSPKNIQRLNEIVGKNNKTGVKYEILGLSKDDDLLATGLPLPPSFKELLIKTPRQEIGGKVIPESVKRFTVRIAPGKYYGDVKDVVNANYMTDFPGLSMVNSSPGIFSDNVVREGSGLYKSLNQFLKESNLGRVKSGRNSLSPSADALWNKAISRGDAFGYYGDPNSIFAIMRSSNPYIFPTAASYGVGRLYNSRSQQ